VSTVFCMNIASTNRVFFLFFAKTPQRHSMRSVYNELIQMFGTARYTRSRIMYSIVFRFPYHPPFGVRSFLFSYDFISSLLFYTHAHTHNGYIVPIAFAFSLFICLSDCGASESRIIYMFENVVM